MVKANQIIDDHPDDICESLSKNITFEGTVCSDLIDIPESSQKKTLQVEEKSVNDEIHLESDTELADNNQAFKARPNKDSKIQKEEELSLSERTLIQIAHNQELLTKNTQDQFNNEVECQMIRLFGLQEYLQKPLKVFISSEREKIDQLRKDMRTKVPNGQSFDDTWESMCSVLKKRRYRARNKKEEEEKID
ncbi:unnamed protein product [Brachionus calyciflorus]|uniref:Uncharacterized protein n=1 Tax=Brachionus calyciflorus TaxID=104777 RepID=A0A814PKS6_9BILA|nr:unnamed protein product [Brachionus calyciflorus]